MPQLPPPPPPPVGGPVENAGQRMDILCRAAWRFTQLNALVASTKSAASQSLSSNIFFIACTAASEPADCPAQVCNRGLAA